MNYKDYERLKVGRYQSVGKIGNIYVYEIPTGFADVPEYYRITKEGFDTFETWSQEFISDQKTLFTIVNRKCVCSAYPTTSRSTYRRYYHYDVAVCPKCGKESVAHVGKVALDDEYEVKCSHCGFIFMKEKD